LDRTRPPDWKKICSVVGRDAFPEDPELIKAIHPLTREHGMRSIADIAQNEGEDLSDPEVALSCVEVFALGGRAGSTDASESGYFAVRGMLAKTVTEAAMGASTFTARRATAQ
jgi:hypothetical protein